ncbi:MAG: hypothetical protein GJ676_04505 [Rhodobacteraceae bacterium]|nr:hypothetical protein [Paracoccaceae bacterium]
MDMFNSNHETTDANPIRPLGKAVAALVLGLTGLCASPTDVGAQETTQDYTVPDSGWNWVVAPYAWMSGLSGQVGVVSGVPPTDIDLPFSDILKNLDMTGMIVAHANNGRFGVSGDLQYYKLSGSNTSQAPNISQVDVRVENTIVTLTGDYLVSSGPDHELWAQAGLRYWRVVNDLTVFRTAPPPVLSGASSNSWVDPLIGMRGRKRIAENTYLSGWAYFGGFGAGSEEMYDLFGGIGYQFTDTTSGVFGYRWMSVDRVDGGFIYDTVQKGPLLGVVFRF